jgi:pilus assembly protein CpaB
MRGNNIIILVVALVLGGIAAILARNWLVSHAQSSSTGTIVVASAPLAFGAQLTLENLTEIPWNVGDIPDGSFATKHDLLKDGRRAALAPIGRKEPILRSKVTAPGQRATLSTTLDAGKRAVTVRVDDVRGVAGFIQPGDRVDVVLIRTGAESKTGDGYSDVILQSAKVLAIDQITGERTEQATIAKAVTLEVSAEEAQKILLATNVGRLSLILRQPDEANGEIVRRVTEKDLSTAPAEVKPAPQAVAHVPAALPPPSHTRHITIWHGLKAQDYERPIGLVSSE